MSRVRNRGLPVLRALLLFGLGGVWAVACGGPQPLGAAGSVCFRADECQAGLACVPETQGSTKRVCSADLSGIVSMVDGAVPEAGGMGDGTGGTPATPQAGAPASNGGRSSAGAAGRATTGGAPGASGSGSTAGAAQVGGASAAGAGGGSGAASPNGGAENGGASAGSAG